MNNKLEGNFNKGVSFIVFFSMLAQACSAQIPTEVSPTFNPQSTEVGGERAEDVNVTDLLAVKQEMTQEETESFNSKLQDPEKEVVTYDPLGNNLYASREILSESRKEAVFLSVEKWVMGESERVFGHTVIDGENMIITESGDRLVALVEVDLVMGQDLSARGFARIGDDGVTLVPEILFGSDNKPYINDGSANFYRLSEDSKILETIDVGELSKEYGGGTLMRNSRMRFKNGVEFVVTPEGDLVSPEFVELQSQIAASGERFTLLPDGTIQQMTSEGAIIVPGLFVDKNGAITLQGLSSQVTISPEDVSFDDTKGVNVAGYTLDEATGLWEVEVSEAITAVTAQMDAWHVDPATYTCAENGESVICTDLEGKEMFNNGQYDVFWLREILVNSGDLMPTKYSQAKGNVLPGTPTDQARIEYFGKVLRDLFVDEYMSEYGYDPYKDKDGKKLGGSAFLLDPENNSWGFVMNVRLNNSDEVEQVLIFETKSNGVIWKKLMSVNRDEIDYFWQNQ